MKQTTPHIISCIISAILLFTTLPCMAQKQDTVVVEKKNNIFNYALKLIKKSSPDTVTQKEYLSTKSELTFIPFEGKIIRNIQVERFGFEKTFIDTTQKINYFGTRVLNNLHRDTRRWAIRDNLFFKAGKPVQAYRLADNERYLRNLKFIRDARILIRPIWGESDSVDILVITKDFFSLTGQLNALTTEKFKGEISDANLFGMAQKVQLSTLLEKSRNPSFGLGIEYTKFNVKNTFINFTAGFSNINRNIYNGTNDEQAIFISLDRPLVSQYSRMAGGLTIGNYQTTNYYKTPNPFFFNYNFNTVDAWIGYNLGVNKYIKDRNRKAKQFISMRYLNAQFKESPSQIGDKLNFRFNSKEALLFQGTFFKQQFYKTNYILGFGTTEDVPYGYNVSVTGGWYRQFYLSRPYFGIDANKYVVSAKGDIIQYFFRAGAFYNKTFQDVGIMGGIAGYSRLLFLENFKLRQYLRLTYARQINRTGLDPLNINNTFGVRYFRADSLIGDQRFSMHSETYTFVNYKAFGFNFSPFALADLALLSPEKQHITKSGMFYGVGAGIRTRNENLVFGTAEFRFVFFPRKANQTKSFEATLRVNLSFRYNSNFVAKPDIIHLNSDQFNNVY